MAYIDDLIASVSDSDLRRALVTEVARIKGRMSFGLVFERHIPETGVLPTLKPRVGSTVMVRGDPLRTHVVEKLTRTRATLRDRTNGTFSEARTRDLLVVATLGSPIFPALTSLETVERDAERPFHAVLNGENYHALQLFTCLFPGSIDCIYIDPPYNTGARDWKYNNHYVDANDSWRHSKWLSFIDKRLRLAKRLLKPDGVLIFTIDHNELHHLGMLLEELFPEARRQLVTICINPGGASGGDGLSRVEEYAIFSFLGDAQPAPTQDDMLVVGSETDAVHHTGGQGVRWEWLLRGGNAWYRHSRPNLCYPILLNIEKTRIIRAGPPLVGEPNPLPTEIDGHPVAWPIRRDGKLGIWRVDGSRLNWLNEQGYVFVSAQDEARGTWTIKYLMAGTLDAIDAGIIEVVGRGDRGEVQVRVAERHEKTAKTMWYRGRHVAGGAGGTQLLNVLLGERNLFPFPKSLYAVRDCLEIAVGDRPNAVVLDFFAGSGTTLHATCLLNAEDGGHRRSILVTNNEVSPDMSRGLHKAGQYPGDRDFEQHGIFEAVTRPRCRAAVAGNRVDGAILEGSYLDGRPLAEGFEENIEFFRLDYLDKDDVELGRAFEAINPCLWLMSGSRGSRRLVEVATQGWAIAEGGAYAVLFDETRLRNFREALSCTTDVERVFLVTDSEEAYAEMAEALGGRWPTSMLYRDYLRNFQINTGDTQ